MTRAWRDRRQAVTRVVGVLAAALFAWWAVAEGASAPGAWYPGALLVLVALSACAVSGVLRRPSGRVGVALALLAGYTAWSFLSIAWADARGDAWDGANRTLLYLTVFTLFATLPWRRPGALLFLAAFVFATAITGAAHVFVDGETAFAGGRLVAPIGYANASAALFGAALWPALLLAVRPETAPVLRGALLAAAGVLAELCVLAQSRGSILAAAAGLVAALALARDRVRVATALGLLALPVLASLPVLLAVFGAESGQAGLGAVAAALAASALALLAAGMAFERLVPHVRPRAIVAVAAVVVAGGGGIAVTRPDDVRLTTGFESGRYDLWRVAAKQFASHPLTGAGADNFAHDYARARRRHEEPLYPHSIFLRAFGQTGLMGAVLFIGFLGLACLEGAGARPDAVAIAALAFVAAWLAHASVEWLWELPAVTAPAFAFLGLAAGFAPDAEPAVGRPPPWLIAVLLLAAASYALPALAARMIERAAREGVGALDDLERARQWNPLTDRADVVGGQLALDGGRHGAARRWFERALRRDRANWYPHVQLALLDLRDGRRGAALERLRRARVLNPLEGSVVAALAAAQRGSPLPPALEQALAERAVPGPLGRRPLACRPVLGLAADCEDGR